MNIKPLPCPFCGSEDIDVRRLDGGVECLACHVWMPPVYSTDKSKCRLALEGWNRRVEGKKEDRK